MDKYEDEEFEKVKQEILRIFRSMQEILPYLK